MLKFEPSDQGLYEKEAGILLADKCLQSYYVSHTYVILHISQITLLNFFVKVSVPG